MNTKQDSENQVKVRKKQKSSSRNGDILTNLAGQAVTIVGKNKVIYSGTFKGKVENGFLVLSEAIIRGNEYEVSVPFVLIDRNHVGHIHPEAQEISKREL